MSNVMVGGSNFNLLQGTVAAGGTLSSQFDLGEYNTLGLLTDSNMVNGTLSFMVSDLPDSQGGVYKALYKSDGTVASIGPVSGAAAISAIALAPIFPYRYVRVKFSIAQTNGVALRLPVRG